MDEIELVSAYREIVRENIEYGFLVERYGVQRMDKTIELVLESVWCVAMDGRGLCQEFQLVFLLFLFCEVSPLKCF